MHTQSDIPAIKLPQPKLISIDTLRPAPRNARTHSKKQLRLVADSIRAFGFTNPVLVDGTGQVIAGHGRRANTWAYPSANAADRLAKPTTAARLCACR